MKKLVNTMYLLPLVVAMNAQAAQEVGINCSLKPNESNRCNQVLVVENHMPAQDFALVSGGTTHYEQLGDKITIPSGAQGKFGWIQNNVTPFNVVFTDGNILLFNSNVIEWCFKNPNNYYVNIKSSGERECIKKQ